MCECDRDLLKGKLTDNVQLSFHFIFNCSLIVTTFDFAFHELRVDSFIHSERDMCTRLLGCDTPSARQNYSTNQLIPTNIIGDSRYSFRLEEARFEA